MSTPGPQIPPPYTGPSIYPNAIVLSVLAALSLLATIPALLLNIKARNLALTIITISIILLDIQNIINPLIWPNDNKRKWPSGLILCDIETKLQLGLTTSIPATTTCICQNLATILSPTQHTITSNPAHRKRRLIVELTLCIGLPIFTMSVHILVQPARFYIYSISGCQYSLDQSLPSLLLIQIWPILLFATSGIYAGLIIIRLIQHRRQTATLFANAQTSKARFTRVFILALAVILLVGPVAIAGFVASWQGATWEWEWSNIHPPYWDRLVLKKESHGKVWLERWGQVAGGFVLFALFGTSRDAVVMYGRWVEMLGLVRVWRAIRRIARPGEHRGDVNVSRVMCAHDRFNHVVGLGDVGESSVVLERLDVHVDGGSESKTSAPQAGNVPRE